MTTAVLGKGAAKDFRLSSSFNGESANLDLIRAVAVLCVLFGHLVSFDREGSHEIAWHFAQMGVLIFFVHTSFVLMLSLERSVERFGYKYLFRDFYTRRFFRIYPLAIFCVLISYFTHGPSAHGLRFWTAKELISNLTLTTNLTYSDIMVGGLWTLPLELQMYLVLPVLFLFVRSRAVRYVALLWLISVPFALIQPEISQRLNTVSYAPCFVAGVLAWRLSLSAKRRVKGWLWPFAFVGTWTFFLIADREHDMIYRYLFCVALGFAIPYFEELRGAILTRPAHLIAKYSYGIYLSHLGAMMFVKQVDNPYRWPLFIVLMVCCPIAMFHLIEQPFIRAGQWIAANYRNRQPNAPVPEPAPSPFPVDNPEPGI